MAKLNNILSLSGTSSPTAIKREVTASCQGNNGYAKAPQGNVEGSLFVLLERQENPLLVLIATLLLHAGINHRQVNWSLTIL
jgi:hypothetical protein